MPTKERNLSLDLYRVVCMFLITFLHAISYSRLTAFLTPGHYNFYLIHGLGVLQRFSITGFTLISAYYLVNSSSTLKKFLSFWIQLVFFSVAIWLCACIFLPEARSWKLAVKSFFPVLSYHYWYPVCYLILLIFAPILNKILRALTQRELLTVIGMLGFFVSVFFQYDPFFEAQVFLGHPSHGLIWFILLYFIAGYLRLYGLRRPKLVGGIVFAASGALLMAIFVAEAIVSANASQVHPLMVAFFRHVNLVGYNSLLPLLLSVSSFVLFLNWKLPGGKWLGRIGAFLAPTAFGVYLIQEHNAIRSALWSYVDILRWRESPWLVPIIVAVFLILWAGSIGVYLLYRLAHKLFLGSLEAGLARLPQRLRK